MMQLEQLDKKISRKDKRLIDRVMLVTSVIYPLTVVPQVVRLYSTHDASGLSVSMWIGFLLFGIIFLLYAIVHRLKPNIISQILWAIADLIMIVGIVMYS